MDEMYEMAFSLILSAGNSKSNSMMAIEASREFRFDEAERLLEQANEEFVNAHEIQNGLIQDEAQGKSREVNLVMVHAQDHLTMAMMARDNAKEFLNLYRMIEKLQQNK